MAFAKSRFLATESDHWTVRPLFAWLAVAALFYSVGELDRSLSLGILVVPIVFAPMLVGVGAALMEVAQASGGRRWRIIGSSLLPPVVIFSGMRSALQAGYTSEWLRFQLEQPHLQARVARENFVLHAFPIGFEGGGAFGGNTFFSYVFDASDQLGKPWGRQTSEWRARAAREPTTRDWVNGNGNPSIGSRALGNHFFLVTVTY